MEDIVLFKNRIGNEDDLSPFFAALVQGLLSAFAGQTDVSHPTRYIAHTSPKALAQWHLAIPKDAIEMDKGRVLLGEAFVWPS